MHPLDLSPHTSSTGSKCIDLESPIKISSFKDNLNNRIPNINKRDKDQGKRGRPRADVLTTLMVEGSTSRSRIRCNKCGRVFPREKSLQAHLRTHTGERPYVCDYPGCNKAFCQSGQLKTHQRLHTGERPFACVVEGCTSRFTHANRHCSQHPFASLKRMEMDQDHVAKLCENEPNPDVKNWIIKYVKQCQERANPRSPLKKSVSEELMDDEPVTGEGRRSWSLPRISSGQSLIAPTVPSPSSSHQLTSSLLSTSLQTAPLTLSPLVPRQSSASSTGSSSSGVSSMSSFSSSSASLLHGNEDNMMAYEPHSEVQNYIYSSQMILQGQYSDMSQQVYALPLTYKSASPRLSEFSLTDYRTPPSQSPTELLPTKPPSPLLLTKSGNPPLHSKPSTPVLPSKPSAHALLNRPPTPTLCAKPSSPDMSSKSPTAAYLCKAPSSPLSASLVAQPTLSKSPPTTSSNIKAQPAQTSETTNSISYRTTPKNREKDRYISALALIELSKG